jgi:transcription-repair coupling factor (superfamily II helicase)
MSLLGVRDISMITTPPKSRQSIVTEIAEFDPRIIADAVRDEVARGGQVYFVHNRVQSIMAIYDYLYKLLRPIRIGVAHGQMPEKELEEVMYGFLGRAYDVLLSTSIIESGIDIPSVNTIVINRADRFGLAQLYQLRGRVGRSQERAFAYLLVPPTRLLTDTARQRLKAIEQHTDLGSGFHLAMRDLEIRGAGNLLGPQQHGFMEEVGFDLYCRLLEEAVAELKGEVLPQSPDVKLETDADIYLPEDYVEEPAARVDIYRRLSDARTRDDIDAIRAELEDRFGRYGSSVENLFDLMEIRIIAAGCGIERVSLHNHRLQLYYGGEKLPSKRKIERFRLEAPDEVEFDVSEGFAIKLVFPDGADRLPAETKKLLRLLQE